MKNFFLGFNQGMVMDHGLDFKDLIILRFIIDGIERKIFVKKVINNKTYYWVKMQGIMDAYPIMNIKSRIVMRRKMKKLMEKGFLNYELQYSNGTYTLYSPTEHLWSLCNPKFIKNEEKEAEVEKVQAENIECNDKEEKVAETVVNYLNQTIRTRYKINSGGTIRYIKKLLKDGFNLEDFKNVIDNKSREWMNTKYERYLRPSTLFRRQNFEEYLNGIYRRGECDYAAYDEY